MFAYRHMCLLVAAAFCAGSLQAHAADGAGNAPGKSFGKLDLQTQWLSPQRFGPSSAFFSAPLGEEIVTPPVRSGAGTSWPAPAAAPMDARAAIADDVQETKPPKARANTTAKRPARPAPPRAAAKRAPSNPMNSYARDTQGPRRQSWPCSGGGICAWQ